ncbi:MAG: D-allose transporter substrate-binding protein [Eubacteriales bacterium]
MKKKTVTKLLSFLLVLMLMFTFASCSNGSDTSDEGDNGEAEIAIILKTLANDYWVLMKEGIEAEAETLGIKVDVYAAQSEDDAQGQLDLLENAISKNYKAIGVAPLSPVNLNTAIFKANEAGIYVGNIDEKVDVDQLQSIGGSLLFFVTTDNVAVGNKAATYIIEQNPDGGQVAIIEGKAGNATGGDRKNGAVQAFEGATGFEIVESQPADWDRSKALDVASNIISKYPDLVAFYCANDTMALGVQQAVVNAGKEDQIIVVGTDGTTEAVEAITAGNLAGTVAQDPAEVGAESLRLLYQAIQDKPAIDSSVIPDSTPIDSKLITK